jgi:hypothetical protein
LHDSVIKEDLYFLILLKTENHKFQKVFILTNEIQLGFKKTMLIMIIAIDRILKTIKYFLIVIDYIVFQRV